MTIDHEVLFEVHGNVGVVTLNRPIALNALSFGMIRRMHAQLREWVSCPSIHAVMVKGAGDKAFCAGGDVRAVHQSITSHGSLHRNFFASEYRLDYYIHRYTKPFVALMDGIVMGGGMGIAQGARVRVVTDRTRMAMPEVGIGLFPDVGASYFLSRLPGGLGTYLAVSGASIGASDALYVGLADAYLPHAAVETFEVALGTLRWSGNHFADICNAVRSLGTVKLPEPTLASLRPAIDRHFSELDIRAIVSSLKAESRPRYVEWARQTLKMLAARSPLMMAVTARQLERGRTMELGACFQMELGMIHHCFREDDFVEGVRAVLIDKDNAPQWNPRRIEDVSPWMIDAFFRDSSSTTIASEPRVPTALSNLPISSAAARIGPLCSRNTSIVHVGCGDGA